MVGDISEKSVDEHKEKMEELTHEEKKKIFTAGESMAEAPMENFLLHNGVELTSKFGQDLHESMLIGYGEGNDRAKQQGNLPETG
jgi:hypothetical protein